MVLFCLNETVCSSVAHRSRSHLRVNWPQFCLSGLQLGHGRRNFFKNVCGTNICFSAILCGAHKLDPQLKGHGHTQRSTGSVCDCSGCKLALVGRKAKLFDKYTCLLPNVVSHAFNRSKVNVTFRGQLGTVQFCMSEL